MGANRGGLLLSRLGDIGASLARSKKGIALIGLGSVGIELNRLDEFSDLDFFAIVEPGYKAEFIEGLDWLGSICRSRIRFGTHRTVTSCYFRMAFSASSPSLRNENCQRFPLPRVGSSGGRKALRTRSRSRSESTAFQRIRRWNGR